MFLVDFPKRGGIVTNSKSIKSHDQNMKNIEPNMKTNPTLAEVIPHVVSQIVVSARRCAVSLAALLVAPSLLGASIKWNTSVIISGNTDDSTAGTLVYAYDGGGSSGAQTINGVPFTGETNDIGFFLADFAAL